MEMVAPRVLRITEREISAAIGAAPTGARLARVGPLIIEPGRLANLRRADPADDVSVEVVLDGRESGTRLAPGHSLAIPPGAWPFARFAERIQK